MFDVNRVMRVLSEILSDQYGAKITVTAIPKKEAEQAREDGFEDRMEEIPA